MAKKPDRSKELTGLRRQAEARLHTTRRDIAAMPVKDVQRLVHELQVHQIELEMQNEELRRIQVELEAARDRYVDLYDFSPVGHLTLDTHGKIKEANLRAGVLLGTKRKELIRQPLARFIAAEDQGTFDRHCQEVLKTGTRQTCELRIREEAGVLRWVSFESLAVHEETEPITHWRTALNDISDRKGVELKLEAQRAQRETIIGAMTDAVIIADESHRVIVFNRAAEAMFLYRADDAIGQPLDRLIPERFRQAHHGHTNVFAERQGASSSMGRPTTLLGIRANGEEFLFEASISHARVDGRRIFTAVLRDITERRRVENQLRESEARLQAILDNSPGMVFLKDVEGRYIHVNRQFERVFHMTREQVAGKTDEAIFPPEQAAAFRANDLKVFQAGGPLEFEEVAMHDDGPHTSIVFKFLLNDQEGKPYALCGLTTDITDRKMAEAALLSSEIFTSGILNSLSAHICVLDKDGVVLRTNDAWNQFARCNSNRVVPSIEVGQNYLDLCRQAMAGGQSTVQIILEGIEAVLAGSEPSFTQEYGYDSPDEERWFVMRVTPLKETRGVVISHTDISARVRMEQTLEEHVLQLSEKQDELESLTGKLIAGQEEERKRIARDLHDDFNQRMAALSVELESMERAAIVPAESLARQLAAIRSQVVQLSDDLHDLAYRLHPSLLEHVGLEVAMRDHVAEFTKRTGLPVTFTTSEVPGTLAPEIATSLFRVMQESLQNVFNHAMATHVTVKLSGSSKGIGLSVRDNGKGFDLGDKSARIKGLGLVSMQERTRGLGGFIRIHSFEREGTKVCAWIPHVPEGT